MQLFYLRTQHLPKSSSQNLQLPECPPWAESMEQNGLRDTKDSIPWAMSEASGILF